MNQNVENNHRNEKNKKNKYSLQRKKDLERKTI